LVAPCLSKPTTHADDTHVGIQLLDAPVSAAADPRANRYIVDHVRPGAELQRRVLVTNSSAASERVEVYPAAAAIVGDSFTFAAGRAQNEMTSWVTVDRADLDVPAHGTAIVTVDIRVPAGATRGEQYGLIWAQVAPATDTGPKAPVTQLYRAGVRIYLDVGPGGAPPTDFAIRSLTATRGADGRPGVVANVENIGGRTLDISGSLELSDGPASQSAGPFPVEPGATLPAGQLADIVAHLDRALPAGPWRVEVDLSSGLVHRVATATLTFPVGAGGTTAALIATIGATHWPAIAAIAAVAVVLVAILVVFLRRCRRRRAALPARAQRPLLL
jgi:hypothetical protein